MFEPQLLSLHMQVHLPLEIKVPIFTEEVNQYNMAHFDKTNQLPSWRELFKVEERVENFTGEYPFSVIYCFFLKVGRNSSMKISI